MGFRFPLLALLFLAAFWAVPGQARTSATPPGPAGPPSLAAAQPVPEDQNAAGADFFPLNLLLDAVQSGVLPWRPDWPLPMPPDAFTLRAGKALSVTLSLPAGYLDAAPPAGDSVEGSSATAKGNAGAASSPDVGASSPAADIAAPDAGDGESLEYRFTRNALGQLLGFPFPLNGTFYQAQVSYGDAGLIKKITLDNPAAAGSENTDGDPGNSSPWEFEFLEYDRDNPSLTRINQGGAWRFAAIQYRDWASFETWYDQEGQALAFFFLEYREDDGIRRLHSIDSRDDQGQQILVYGYDSGGRISALDTPGGSHATLYTAEGRPRYWERPEGNYTLQWDETGLLTFFTGAEDQADIRYEYTLDTRGNWTERREISLIRRFGRLVPASEAVISRTITYGDE
jgi:hypothetical protein